MDASSQNAPYTLLSPEFYLFASERPEPTPELKELEQMVLTPSEGPMLSPKQLCALLDNQHSPALFMLCAYALALTVCFVDAAIEDASPADSLPLHQARSLIQFMLTPFVEAGELSEETLDIKMDKLPEAQQYLVERQERLYDRVPEECWNQEEPFRCLVESAANAAEISLRVVPLVVYPEQLAAALHRRNEILTERVEQQNRRDELIAVLHRIDLMHPARIGMAYFMYTGMRHNMWVFSAAVQELVTTQYEKMHDIVQRLATQCWASLDAIIHEAD
jgi:hypothetical protein